MDRERLRISFGVLKLRLGSWLRTLLRLAGVLLIVWGGVTLLTAGQGTVIAADRLGRAVFVRSQMLPIAAIFLGIAVVGILSR